MTSGDTAAAVEQRRAVDVRATAVLRDVLDEVTAHGGDVGAFDAPVDIIFCPSASTWHLDTFCQRLHEACDGDVGNGSTTHSRSLRGLLDDSAVLCLCASAQTATLRAYLHRAAHAVGVADTEARIVADPSEHRWVLLHRFSTFSDEITTFRTRILEDVTARRIPASLYEQLESSADRIEIRHHAISGTDRLRDICGAWHEDRFSAAGQRWWQLYAEHQRTGTSSAHRRWFAARSDGASRGEARSTLDADTATVGLRRERRLRRDGEQPAATWAIPADSDLVVSNVARRQYQVAANRHVAICVVGAAADDVLAATCALSTTFGVVRLGEPIGAAAAQLACELWGSELSPAELYATASVA